MTNDATIKLVLETSEALQSAKAFTPKLQKALTVNTSDTGLKTLVDELKEAADKVGALSEKTGNVKGVFSEKQIDTYTSELSTAVNLATQLQEINEKLATYEKGGENYLPTLQGKIGAATKAGDTVAADDARKAYNAAKEEQKTLIARQTVLATNLDKQMDKVEKVGKKVADVTNFEKAHGEKVSEINDKYDGFVAKVEGAEQAQKNAETATEQTADAQQQITSETEQTANAQQNVTSATQQTGAAISANVAKTQQANTAQAQNIATTNNVANAQTNLAQKTQQANNAQTQATATTQQSNAANQQTTTSLADLVMELSNYRTQLDATQAAGQNGAAIAQNLLQAFDQLEGVLSTPLDTASYPELIRLLGELQAAIKRVKTEGMPTNIDNEFTGITQKLYQTKAAITAYEQAFKGAKSNTQSSANSMKSSISGISPQIKALKDAFGNVASQAGKLKSAFSGITSAIKGVKSNFTGMASNMKSNFKSLITSITKYVLGFRSLFFLVRRLRTYVGEGIQNLAQWNDGNNEVNDSITDMLTSLLYLKNSWAAAFSPIITTVRPYLTALIDKLAEASNTIAQFLTIITSGISGNTTAFQAVKVQAEDYADSLDDTGSSASGAADAVENLTDRLAAFDDLNVLGKDTDDTGSGSGGGGSEDTYSPDVNDMFTTVEAVSELGEMIKDAWEKADFSELGALLNAKIIEAFQSIKWNEIQEYAAKIGASLGSFLSGLLSDPTLFTEAGSAIAEGLNTITIAVDNFLRETDGVDFGGGFAALINGFIDNVDWELINSNILNFVTQFRDNVISFLTTLDWAGIQDALSGFATTIGQAINETLGNSEFTGTIGSNLAETFNTIIGGLNSLFTTVNGDELGASVANFFRTLIEQIDWTQVGQTLGNGVTLIFNSLSSFFENTPTDEIEQAFLAFFNGVDWEGLFGSITRLIISSNNSLTEFSASLTNALAEILNDPDVANNIAGIISTIIENIDIASMTDALLSLTISVINLLASSVGAIIPAAAGLLVGIIEGLVNNEDLMKAPAEVLLESFFRVMGLGEFSDLWTSFIQTVEESGFWDGLTTKVSDGWDDIKSIFWLAVGVLSAIWETIIAKVVEVWDGIKEKIDTVVTWIWENMPQPIKDALQVVQNKFEEWKTTISNVWDNLKAKIRMVVIFISSWLQTQWASIRTKAIVAFSLLKDKVLDIWDNLKEGLKTPLNGIIGFLNMLISSIETAINNIVNAVNSISFEIPDYVPEWGGKTVGFDLATVSLGRIPALAQGAVIPPNKEFMAILGDQSSGTNIEAPLDTIKQAVAEELSEQIGVLQEGFASVVQAINSKELAIGDKQIGQASARYNAQQARIRGVNW